ncbi:hypothetical protein Q9966_011651 [Columba livia]|nr:hypothetical protein Q9966_011651 [Columba livia]
MTSGPSSAGHPSQSRANVKKPLRSKLEHPRLLSESRFKFALPWAHREDKRQLQTPLLATATNYFVSLKAPAPGVPWSASTTLGEAIVSQWLQVSMELNIYQCLRKHSQSKRGHAPVAA